MPGDDIVCPSGDGALEHHVVLRVTASGDRYHGSDPFGFVEESVNELVALSWRKIGRELPPPSDHFQFYGERSREKNPAAVLGLLQCKPRLTVWVKKSADRNTGTEYRAQLVLFF